MKKLINYIRSFFCKHEWELIDKANVFQNDTFMGKVISSYPIGTEWFYICKKCGDMKIQKNF